MHHGLRQILYFGRANISRQHFERRLHPQASVWGTEPLRHGFIGGEYLSGEAVKPEHPQEAF